MNIETLKKFYEESSYRISLDWNEFQQLAEFSPTDSYEACEYQLKSILSYLPQDDTRAWRYFQAVYEDIPVRCRMKLFFEYIYRLFSVDYPSVLVMLGDYIHHQETSEMKAERINAVRKYFEANVTQDGKITLYRCVMEGCLLPRSAVKFTTNRDDAERDVNEHDECFGVVYCCEVDVEDILYYSDDNKVFIVPEDIKSGTYGYSDDLGVLGIDILKEDFPSEYEELSSCDNFDDLCDYPIVYCYIAPDLSLNEIVIEATEAQNKGNFRLYDKLLKNYKQREEEYLKKLADESAGYLKARQAK